MVGLNELILVRVQAVVLAFLLSVTTMYMRCYRYEKIERQVLLSAIFYIEQKKF